LHAIACKSRDAEEAFLAEKGALRREVDAQRRRATKAEQELAQLQARIFDSKSLERETRPARSSADSAGT
jgi:hypothetical protein